MIAVRGGDRTNSWRRLWSRDALPTSGMWCTGPKWRRHCGIQEVPIVDIIGPVSMRYHRPGRKILAFSLEDEVRERVLEELRPGVYAEWSDPL